ncbi:MAG: polysaccharide pyruvyl transferase family protein, partial [Acetobacteraceae bacterium]
LVILRVDLSDPDRVVCTEAWRHAWDGQAYEETWGELRGGATPVLRDGHYHFMAHSVFPGEADQAGTAGLQLCYVGALMVLQGQPPFGPVLHSGQPLLALTPREQHLPHTPRLDPRCAEAAYPSGAITDGDDLIVSYGINERYAALRRIPWREAEAGLAPVIRRNRATLPARAWLAAAHPGRDASPDASPDAARDIAPDAARDIASDAASGPMPADLHRFALRAWWWRPGRRSPRASVNGEGRFTHGNFGDLLAPHLLGRMTGFAPRWQEDGVRLLTVGSLLQAARDGDVVWGAGFNGGHAAMRHAPRHLHVRATRGPISCDYLRRAGFDVSRVTQVFDPAILIGHLFAAEVAALRARIGNPPRNFILIPHFRDEAVMRRRYPAHAERIRSPDMPFFQMVAEILRSDLVVSSSLHGLIVAEALGVPAVWHRPVMGEDELKFHDYYLGTGRYRIVRVDTLDEAFTVSPMPLPTIDAAAMLATFPSFAELEELGVMVPPAPVPVGEAVSFAAPLPDSIVLESGWSSRESHGVWSDGERAHVELFVGEHPGADLVVELGLQGYVPRPDLPRRVIVSDDGGVLGAFEIVHARPVTFRFPLARARVTEGSLRLTFAIPEPLSPASVAGTSDTRRLGVALTSFRLRPASIPTTRDPDLHLAVGAKLYRPVSEVGRRRVFEVAVVDGPVRLLSRKAQPGEGSVGTFGLVAEDRRRLGVGVQEIVVSRGDATVVIAPDHRGLDHGWWPVEGAPGKQWRWTNGAAIVPVERGGAARIEVDVALTSSYPLL